MARKQHPAGGFGPKAEFFGMDSEERTIMEDEVDEPENIKKLRDSSLNARKQNPYGPQFPALDRYFKAK